ncbi:MAG: class I SAM-dependent methyltransferase, partial [Bacteroidales bacterium]|nr:class I SAM-dependent methyltransferase [Bacteroidales bacterium]
FFLNTERQGPGSPQMTVKAREFIHGLTDDSLIADLGCGTGGQTMVLARHAPGCITGLDMFPAFIDRFNSHAEALGLSERVKGIVGSMDTLPFAKESLDLIWSEGAIYNIGFERGLNYWRDFLKPGGYVAVTENSWFTDKRPMEITDFWMDCYPEIDTIPHKVAQMQDAGYMPVAVFALPENCWTDNYYRPMHAVRERFLRDNPGNPTAEELVKFSWHEESLYDKYKDFYGYVFYIGRKI